MVDIGTIGRLTAGLILLLGNGYFVTIEFAMTRVRQFTQDEFQGSRGLERAWEMTEQLEIFLSGCQLGITICSVGLGVVAEPALAAVVDPVITAIGLGGILGLGGGGHTALAALTSLAIINLLHLTVGEQAPTYLGIERSKQVAKYGAPVLYWWTRVFLPIIRLADWSAKALLSIIGVEMTRSWAEEEVEEGADTRQGLINQMGSTMANIGIPADRREEIINAVAIDNIHASDLMVGRDEIITLSTEKPFETNLETIRSYPHTRFPLIGTSIDDVIGTIYLPAVVQSQEALEQQESELTDIASPTLTVAPDIPISDLIDTFQEADQEIALVVDNGRTVGAITATDAFEAITGELEDPLDRS